MRVKTNNERRVGRRNLIAGLLSGVILATVAGAYATTTFKKMVSGQKATAADVNKAHQDLADAIDKLEAKVTAQAAKIAKLETDPDCPPGYTRDTTAPSSITVCTKGKDEMVKVGDFWVDRYETVIVDSTQYKAGTCGGPGTPYGQSSDNYPSAFPDSGNWTAAYYACSIKGVKPSANMTWFQAQQACVNSGKHLCTNSEWQAAAAGTHDPGVNNGDQGGKCNTSSKSNLPRNTGIAVTTPSKTTDCVSKHGTEDMVGNLSEWVALWGQAGQTNPSFSFKTKLYPWPSGFGYGTDRVVNINGAAENNAGYTYGVPAAGARGGHWYEGSDAGAYTLHMGGGPSYSTPVTGARCCRR